MLDRRQPSAILSANAWKALRRKTRLSQHSLRCCHSSAIHDDDVWSMLAVILWAGPLHSRLIQHIPKPKVTYEVAANLLPIAIALDYTKVLDMLTPVFAENLKESKVCDMVALKSHDTVSRILDSDELGFRRMRSFK